MERDPRISEPFYIDGDRYGLIREEYRRMAAGGKGRGEDELSYRIRELEPGQALLVRPSDWGTIAGKNKVKARTYPISKKTGGKYRVSIDMDYRGILVIREPDPIPVRYIEVEILKDGS